MALNLLLLLLAAPLLFLPAAPATAAVPYTQCRFVSNLTYTDSTVRSVPANSSAACCSACLAAGSAVCAAAVYSGADGTCSLKATRNGPYSTDADDTVACVPQAVLPPSGPALAARIGATHWQGCYNRR